MRTPTSRGWRLLRAGVFAVIATQLAALGHLLAGGALPDLAVLVTVTVFLGGSLSGFAGRRRTGPQILGALLASQLAFHVAFALTAHPMSPRSVSSIASRSVSVHSMSAHAVTSPTMASSPMTGELGLAGESARMIAFHLLAAIAAAWLMTAGERTLFRLFAALHRVLFRIERTPPIGLSPGWIALVPAGSVGLRLSATELCAASRRGPPYGPVLLPA